MSEEMHAALAVLRERRSKLDTAIQALEEILGIDPEEPLVGYEGAAGTVPSKTVNEDSFIGLSAPKAAFAYLQMVNKPQTTRQIADALEQGGVVSTSDNFMARVYTGLSRHKEIVRLGKKWGLRQNHPGARETIGKKKPANGAAEESED